MKTKKPKTKMRECESCTTMVPKEVSYCQTCIEGIAETALIDMYGEEDGAYFAAIDWFPGDN